MFSSRLLWRFFAIYAGLGLATAIVFALVLTRRVDTALTEQMRERLDSAAVVLRTWVQPQLNTVSNEPLQQELSRLGVEMRARLTVFTADGQILADSENSRLTRQPADDLSEIIEARGAGRGFDIRSTRGVPVMYVAIRVDDGTQEPAGFVRVAAPMSTVREQIASIHRRIWITAIVALLLTLACTYWLVSRVVRPLMEISRSTREMARGRFNQHVDVAQRDELGMLASAFNEMSGEVSEQINSLELRANRLEHNRERLETVLSAMVEGVIAIDDRERVLFINPAARSLLDFAGTDVVNRPIWESLRNSKIHDLARTVLSGRIGGQVELELPRSRAVASVTARPLPGDPCPGVVLVLHDITELRRLENMRREFVSNVSHELKTPLTSIQACAETLLDGALEDAEHNRGFVQRIEEHAMRLHSLILDLLRLARIETGKDVFDLVPVSVGHEVELCLAEHSHMAQSKTVTLTAEPPNEELRVIADAEGLRTILDNLVDNAIKYTPQGGKVTVRWKSVNSTVVIQVEDSGVGIAKEHQSRIFERFYRIDRARSRELGGTGLGLAIVKHLTQVFSGSVSVESERGRGSTFSVRLPMFDDE